jgi:transposase-like protein
MTVRKAIRSYEDQTIQVLDGTVEVDESYFGAQFPNRRREQREKLRKAGKVKRGRGANDRQQAVFGIYERAVGIVYVEPVKDVTQETLQDILQGKVTVSSTVYSDTWKSYNGLKETFEEHETIEHRANEYARDDVTINGIEGFWAFAEEEFRDHHGVGSKHFEDYLKEKEYRWNYRFLNQEAFVRKLLEILTHKNQEQLTS